MSLPPGICPCGIDHREIEKLQDDAQDKALANPKLAFLYESNWMMLEFTKMFASPIESLLPLLGNKNEND